MISATLTSPLWVDRPAVCHACLTPIYSPLLPTTASPLRSTYTSGLYRYAGRHFSPFTYNFSMLPVSHLPSLLHIYTFDLDATVWDDFTSHRSARFYLPRFTAPKFHACCDSPTCACHMDFGCVHYPAYCLPLGFPFLYFTTQAYLRFRFHHRPACARVPALLPAYHIERFLMPYTFWLHRPTVLPAALPPLTCRWTFSALPAPPGRVPPRFGPAWVYFTVLRRFSPALPDVPRSCVSLGVVHCHRWGLPCLLPLHTCLRSLHTNYLLQTGVSFGSGFCHSLHTPPFLLRYTYSGAFLQPPCPALLLHQPRTPTCFSLIYFTTPACIPATTLDSLHTIPAS